CPSPAHARTCTTTHHCRPPLSLSHTHTNGKLAYTRTEVEDIMQPYLRKLRKLKRSKPSSLEESVAKTLFELETSHKTLRQELPRFHINSAREVKVPRSKKTAMVVFYPLRFLMLVRKVQRALTSELEKRHPGYLVMLVAQRKITKRPNDVYKLQKVQRSKTSSAVFENILNDLIYPSDVVGRRWRYRTDGSKLMKVFLDARDRKRIESRLRAVAYVYKQLTHRRASFGFMWNPKLQQVSTQ
ncbi:Ribosomal protein S7e, partial [Leishmania braziliensis]